MSVVATGQFTLIDTNDHVNVTYSAPPPPLNPTDGDLWFDTTNNNAMYYYASNPLTTPAAGTFYPETHYWIQTEASYKARVFYGDSKPTSSNHAAPPLGSDFNDGDVWVNTANGSYNIYIWVSSSADWVLTNNISYLQSLYNNIADDNILSLGEKPRVTVDWESIKIEATDKTNGILQKALILGVDTTTFSSAYLALRDYMESILYRADLDRKHDTLLPSTLLISLGILPTYVGEFIAAPTSTQLGVTGWVQYAVYKNTSGAIPAFYILNGSPLVWNSYVNDGGTIWSSLWKNYFTAKTGILLALQSATAPFVTAVYDGSAISLTQNTSLPTIDGNVTLVAGNTVMLIKQPTIANDGVYTVVQQGSNPSAGVATAPSSYTASNSYGTITGSGTGPYVITPYNNRVRKTVFTWASNAATSGTVNISFIVEGFGDEPSAATVEYSTDSGLTWLPFNISDGSLFNSGSYTYSLPLNSIDVSKLQIHVIVDKFSSQISNIKYVDQYPTYTEIITGGCSVSGLNLNFTPSAISGINWSLSLKTKVTSGTLWNVLNGQNYGGKKWKALASTIVDAPNNLQIGSLYLDPTGEAITTLPISAVTGAHIFETIAITGQTPIAATTYNDTLTLEAGTGITLATNSVAKKVTITGTASQNIFSKVSVATQTDIVADSTTTALTVAAGTGITLTTNAASKTLTITGTPATSAQDNTDSSSYYPIFSTAQGTSVTLANNSAYRFTPSSGTLGIKQIQYATSGFTANTSVGNTYWDSTNVTLATVLDTTGGVTLQHGQELHVRVKNTSGALIPNGSAVFVNSASTNKPTIRLAKADLITNSNVLGVATQDIADAADGFVTVFGTVNGFDTSGFNAGDTLYLDGTIAGKIVNTSPTYSTFGFAIAIGTALNKATAGNGGAIFVRTSPPIALDTALNGDSNLVSPSQHAVKTYVASSIPTGTTPGLTLGTSNSIGSSASFIKADATIAIFDSTAASSIALGDSATNGSVAFAARRDHKHAMPTLHARIPVRWYYEAWVDPVDKQPIYYIENNSGITATIKAIRWFRDDNTNVSQSTGIVLRQYNSAGTVLQTWTCSIPAVGIGYYRTWYTFSPSGSSLPAVLNNGDYLELTNIGTTSGTTGIPNYNLLNLTIQADIEQTVY